MNKLRRRDKKWYKNYKYAVLGLVIFFIGAGFAFLNTGLSIKGSTEIEEHKWSVKFNNINITKNTNESTAVINAEDNTKIDLAVTFEEPGDSFEFTADIVNEGTVDAMITQINNIALTEEQQKFIDYSVTYNDGIEIQNKDLLAKNSTDTIKVSFKYKDDANDDEYPIEDQTIELSFDLTYSQADDSAKEVKHDPLLTFINKAKAGNVTEADLGKEFEIDMGSTYGVHKVRVANVSSPSDFCSNPDNSQTACGVVLEFTDIITTHNMNPTGEYKGTQYDYGWNKDGYPGSQMYEFLNNDIYNSIPKNIRDLMVETRVVSGYGSGDANGTGPNGNWVSNDKLYLLDSKEVYGTSFTSSYNQAKGYERQLDYYESLGVTTSNYSGAIKKNGTSNSYWWLRSANSNYADIFYIVNTDGTSNDSYAATTIGVSPVFRIS